MIVAVALGLLFVLFSDDMATVRANLGLSRDKPADIMGRVYCRPNCRASFQRCGVSTSGFVFEESRCQETLKQCLKVCDNGGRKF